VTDDDGTPLLVPPIDFATPTGDEMVAIDKGFGGGGVGGRRSWWRRRRSRIHLAGRIWRRKDVEVWARQKGRIE
jgi:hypothetical protein